MRKCSCVYVCVRARVCVCVCLGVSTESGGITDRVKENAFVCQSECAWVWTRVCQVNVIISMPFLQVYCYIFTCIRN